MTKHWRCGAWKVDSVCWHYVVTQMEWHAYSSMIIALSPDLTTKPLSCGTSPLHMNFWLLAEQRASITEDSAGQGYFVVGILQLTLNYCWNCVMELTILNCTCVYNSNLLLVGNFKIEFLNTFPLSSVAFNYWTQRLIYYHMCHFNIQFLWINPE